MAKYEETNILSREQAKAAGVERFFSGRPCVRYHFSERNVKAGYCYACRAQESVTNIEASRERSRHYYHQKGGAARKAQYYLNNKDSIVAKRSERLDESRAFSREYARRNRAKNIEYNRRYWTKERRKHYLTKNRDRDAYRYAANSAKRRAAKKMATPAWADMKAVQEIYRKCAAISRKTGIIHHVDHVIPLQSDLVCGLHCEANLQILKGPDNMRKHNKFTCE